LKNNDRTEGKSMNEAGTGAYSCAEAVPMTANELERWLVANQSIAATELYDAGYCAWLSLRAMEAGAAHQSEVMDAMNRRDLLAFLKLIRAKDSLNLCL
jgi:hypothetical protein